MNSKTVTIINKITTNLFTYSTLRKTVVTT